MIRIPFNRPSFVGNEPSLIQEAITAGHFSGDGIFTKKCHLLLENELGVKKALLTTNCTHALEMSALLLDIKPGDEFLVPSFTFVSTANAFVLRGAKPVFVDCRPGVGLRMSPHFFNTDEEVSEAMEILAELM